MLLVAVLYAWVGESPASPASADPVQQPDAESVYTIDFSATAQSKYTPGPGFTPGDLRRVLVREEWDESGSVEAKTSFGGTTFLGAAITFVSGDDAFLGPKGVLQTHSASASDKGSDDLRYDWAFSGMPDRFGGTLPPSPETESTTTFNDGSAPGTLPFTDPARDAEAGAHPHGTFPFSSGDFADLTVNDDDDGTDYQELPKLVTDDCDCVEHESWWKSQFKERKPSDQKKVDKGKLLGEESLQAYLDIVAFASSRFGEDVALATVADARNVFDPPRGGNGNTGGSGGGQNNDASRNGEGVTGTGGNLEKKRQDATRVTLAAWLNFAEGGVLWQEEITVEKSTGTGTGSTPAVVMPFNELIAEVESILKTPTRRRTICTAQGS